MSRDYARITKVLNHAIDTVVKHGDSDYIGEHVTQIQHALQAAKLAEESYLGRYFTIACLLHDVGHLVAQDDTGGFGCKDHGEAGAEYLRNLGLPPEVTEPVRLHVAAKRYIVTTDPDYYNRLSSASKETLRQQGGMMSKEEMQNFQRSNWYLFAIELRKIDDKAKDTALVISPDTINKYRNYLSETFMS